MKCDHKCEECSTSSSNCSSCRGDRTGASCECPVGTYDDGTSENCIAYVCAYRCNTCEGTTELDCLTCKGNNR